MRLPRMTTRWWMIAVAVASVLLLLPIMGITWFLSTKDIRAQSPIDAYKAKATYQWYRQVGYLRLASEGDGRALVVRNGQRVCVSIENPELSAKYRELATYHDALRRKYERAARYRWLPVEADPPEPERVPSGASG
jgi:hypothetical protein